MWLEICRAADGSPLRNISVPDVVPKDLPWAAVSKTTSGTLWPQESMPKYR